ncbi:MAG: phosphate starvation-inducible protein PhoH [Halobacteriovoraceae bacterium]|nr:phosphate starvation-inducible protein PhoH [Peredibacter sp.]MBJ00298.1 phosphate starvation-inducible protein PhoH [Halobacteriovoraceae bacterium]
MATPKTFILDTNVLLFDPSAINKFGENKVFIPLVVIEELDRFKKDQNENGRNARYFARLVDELREEGSLVKGVKLANGGTLQISILREPATKHAGIDLSINDNLILANALYLKEQGEECVVISKDINLRLKGDALGLKAEDYETSEITIEELYSGQRNFEVTGQRLTDFEQNRFLELSEEEQKQFYPNEYLIVHEENNPQRRQLGRYFAKKGGIVPLIKSREGVWGIYPKNVEQQFAFDALMNNEIKLVSLVGKAGTGKTLLAIAAGLECAITQQQFSRVLVSRPIVPMGRDLGFLPGDVNEKLGPWMQPIFDNIDFLFGNQRSNNQATTWDELINEGLLHVEPLTYIRGRSLPNQYMIVDEAQNLTPHEIKTIITRAGEGTKIVLTGDSEQIDNPYLDSINNGLVYSIDKLKNVDIVAHTKLQQGERSPLSEIASELL